MKRLTELILLVFFLAACHNGANQNSMRGKHEFYLKKEQTGEEYFTYLDDNGIANGPLKIKYSDGGYSTGFFKNGKKDSLFKTYGKAGVLKAITYYIDGKENGEHFIYSDLGNIVASVFMENNKMKTKKGVLPSR